MAQRKLFSLRLGPESTGASIHVQFEGFISARRIYKPRRIRLARLAPQWLAVSAAVSFVALIALSLAAGAVGIATPIAPPAPTSLPGQPTATPAPRALRLGNLVIEAPAPRPQTGRGQPAQAGALANDAEGTAAAEATAAESPLPDTSVTEPAEVDSPLLRVRRATAVPRPIARPTEARALPLAAVPDDASPELQVLPIASPAAESPNAGAPRPGSALQDALFTASAASAEFNRGLREPPSNATRP